MLCTKCDTQNDTEANFCHKCGTSTTTGAGPVPDTATIDRTTKISLLTQMHQNKLISGPEMLATIALLEDGARGHETDTNTSEMVSDTWVSRPVDNSAQQLPSTTMTFGKAIKYCLKQYGNFQGVASRTQFWLFYLFTVLAGTGGYFGAYMWAQAATTKYGYVPDRTMSMLTILVVGPTILTMEPLLAAATRRLHDTGRSGHLLWWLLIPVGGAILVAVMLSRKSTDGMTENRYVQENTITRQLPRQVNGGVKFVDRNGEEQILYLLEGQMRKTILDLRGANLVGYDLRGANLRKANLEGANLTNTDLRKSFLAQANLTNANMTGANMSGANIHGANFTGVDLTKVVMRRTKGKAQH